MFYAIFLRGINTNGLKLLIQDFITILQSVGCHKAITIQAAGTAVIERDQPPDLAWQAELTSQLFQFTGKQIHAMIRTQDQLDQMVVLADEHPVPEDCHQYILITENDNLYEELHQLHQKVPYLPDEQLWPGSGCILWTIPQGQTLGEFGSKILGSNRYKKQLTSRNINTIKKALAIMNDLNGQNSTS